MGKECDRARSMEQPTIVAGFKRGQHTHTLPSQSRVVPGPRLRPLFSPSWSRYPMRDPHPADIEFIVKLYGTERDAPCRCTLDLRSLNSCPADMSRCSRAGSQRFSSQPNMGRGRMKVFFRRRKRKPDGLAISRSPLIGRFVPFRYRLGVPVGSANDSWIVHPALGTCCLRRREL